MGPRSRGSRLLPDVQRRRVARGDLYRGQPVHSRLVLSGRGHLLDRGVLLPRSVPGRPADLADPGISQRLVPDAGPSRRANGRVTAGPPGENCIPKGTAAPSGTPPALRTP